MIKTDDTAPETWVSLWSFQRLQTCEA